MDNFGYRTYGVTDEEASKLRGMGWEWSQRLLRFKSPTNKVLDMGDTFKIIRNTEESDMSSKVAHAMTAITKQYAPDEDFAWAWIRKANEMGWVWGAHAHKVGSLAPTPVIGFSNGDGVYVGITLFAGKIWWSWFTGEEWGPGGRDLCLSGHRARHETPIAAIAEYEFRANS
jgi:hypothetical protein